MTREIILPADEQAWLALRCRDLTSTDIPALFGMSPYKTLFELWHEKRSGERPAFVVSDRMRWGSRLESVIAHGIADDQGWTIRPMKEYSRIPLERLGSSFDFRVLSAPITFSEVAPNVASNGFCMPDWPEDSILEIKTVDARAFASGWIVEPDFIEAPAHIELQVQHQLLVSGLPRAVIGVLVGGNDVRLLHRVADIPTHDAIRAAAADFWESIAENDPPDPTMPRDAAAVIRMNAYAEPGKFLDARDNAALAGMAAEYNRLGKEARDLENLREVLKADMLRAIGDHEKAALAGWKISAGIVGPCDVSYTRKPYRDFRITQVKPAKSAA